MGTALVPIDAYNSKASSEADTGVIAFIKNEAAANGAFEKTFAAVGHEGISEEINVSETIFADLMVKKWLAANGYTGEDGKVVRFIEKIKSAMRRLKELFSLKNLIKDVNDAYGFLKEGTKIMIKSASTFFGKMGKGLKTFTNMFSKRHYEREAARDKVKGNISNAVSGAKEVIGNGLSLRNWWNSGKEMVSGIKSGYNGEEAESGSIFGKLGSFLGKGYGKSKDSVKSTKDAVKKIKDDRAKKLLENKLRDNLSKEFSAENNAEIDALKNQYESGKISEEVYSKALEGLKERHEKELQKRIDRQMKRIQDKRAKPETTEASEGDKDLEETPDGYKNTSYKKEVVRDILNSILRSPTNYWKYGQEGDSYEPATIVGKAIKGARQVDKFLTTNIVKGLDKITGFRAIRGWAGKHVAGALHAAHGAYKGYKENGISGIKAGIADGYAKGKETGFRSTMSTIGSKIISFGKGFFLTLSKFSQSLFGTSQSKIINLKHQLIQQYMANGMTPFEAMSLANQDVQPLRDQLNARAAAEAQASATKKATRKGGWMDRMKNLFSRDKSKEKDPAKSKKGFLDMIKENGSKIGIGAMVIGAIGMLSSLNITMGDVVNAVKGTWNVLKSVGKGVMAAVSGISSAVKFVMNMGEKISYGIDFITTPKRWLPKAFGGMSDKEKAIWDAKRQGITDKLSVDEEGNLRKEDGSYFTDSEGNKITAEEYNKLQNNVKAEESTMAAAGRYTTYAAGAIGAGMAYNAGKKFIAKGAEKVIGQTGLKALGTAGKFIPGSGIVRAGDALLSGAGKIGSAGVNGIKALSNAGSPTKLLPAGEKATSFGQKLVGMLSKIVNKVKGVPFVGKLVSLIEKSAKWIAKYFPTKKVMKGIFKLVKRTAIKAGPKIALKVGAKLAAFVAASATVVLGIGMIAWDVFWFLKYWLWDGKGFWSSLSEAFIGTDLFNGQDDDALLEEAKNMEPDVFDGVTPPENGWGRNLVYDPTNKVYTGEICTDKGSLWDSWDDITLDEEGVREYFSNEQVNAARARAGAGEISDEQLKAMQQEQLAKKKDEKNKKDDIRELTMEKIREEQEELRAQAAEVEAKKEAKEELKEEAKDAKAKSEATSKASAAAQSLGTALGEGLKRIFGNDVKGSEGSDSNTDTNANANTNLDNKVTAPNPDALKNYKPPKGGKIDNAQLKASLAKYLAKSDLTEEEKIAFLANVETEVGSGKNLVEGTNWRYDNAVPQNNSNFRKFRPSKAEWDAMTPAQKAEFLYTNTKGAGPKGLGNTQPGDGAKYIGRGVIQLTGRELYTKANKIMKSKYGVDADIVNNPELVGTDTDIAVASSLAWWELNRNRLKKASTARDGRKIRNITNGGNHGMDRFLAAYAAYQAGNGLYSDTLNGEKVLSEDKETGVKVVETDITKKELNKINAENKKSEQAQSNATSNTNSNTQNTSSTSTPPATNTPNNTNSTSVPHSNTSGNGNATSSSSVSTNELDSKIKKNGNVDLEHLRPATKSALNALATEYEEKYNRKLQINSAARTMDAQQRLYDKYGPGKAAKPSPHSPHISGLAFDINSSDGNMLDKNGLLDKYGLWRPLKNGLGRTKPEAWHIELKGSRDSNMKITDASINNIDRNFSGSVPNTKPAGNGLPAINDPSVSDTTADGVEAKDVKEEKTNTQSGTNNNNSYNVPEAPQTPKVEEHKFADATPNSASTNATSVPTSTAQTMPAGAVSDTIMSSIDSTLKESLAVQKNMDMSLTNIAAAISAGLKISPQEQESSGGNNKNTQAKASYINNTSSRPRTQWPVNRM